MIVGSGILIDKVAIFSLNLFLYLSYHKNSHCIEICLCLWYPKPPEYFNDVPDKMNIEEILEEVMLIRD